MTSKLFGLVAGIGIGMAALAGGDIYEIVPCTELGTTTNAYATIDSPLTSGETVYFKLRLAPRTMAGTPWHLEHIGYGSQIVDDAMFPLQIGIFVSGDLRWAKLLRENVGTPENNYISEFVFSYKTRPGDFALPIVLAATETQPVVDCDETNSLLVDGMGKWKIVNAGTVEGSDECNFWQWANAYPISGAGSRNGDFTLTSCGFYVRSMDFDSKWESDGTLWRSVHEGSTITVGAAPKIVAAGAPEDLVNLYVWSTDESAVRIKGGKATEIVTGYNGGTPVVSTCNVATVQFAAGQLSSSFLIEGVKEGETCNLVLSAWPNFRYDGSRNRYTDYIQVPVKCIEPMPPTVIVESSESAVYADSNYRVAKATLSVRVSQAYSNKLDVTVVPKFADGDTTLNWGDYVRFSPNANQVSSLPSADSLPTVTIPANSTEAQSLYVFFLRSDAHTTGGASQIDFTPELTDATAIADFGSYLTAAGVEVLPSPAVITFPKETTKVSGVAGEANKLQVSVKDDFADETFFDEDGNKGYEVTVKSTDFAAPVTLPGYYYIGAGGQLLLAKKNEATGKYEKSSESPTITFPSDASSTTAEPYTSTVQVKSPVSGEIAEQTFLSVVARQRSATLTLVDGKYEINEGDKVPFKVSLSQGYEGTLYAYLRVRGNYAGMFRENSCVVCDDSDFSKTRGQIINMGMTETSQFLVQVLDGYSEDQPLTVQFQLEFCTTEYYSTSDKVNGYGSVPVTITSYNVEPTIKRLTLNGFDAEEDGYRFPFKLPKGMEQTVNAVVNDKGTYDVKSTATNDMFYTKWTCYLDGAAKTNATVRGNPETNPFVFNFPASGEWRVRCQVRDKDMDDWSEVDRSFYVTVLDNPTLEVKAVTPNLEGALVPIDDIYENDTKCKVQVQASYWDSAYYGVLTAKVTVAEYTPKTNPGFIKLDHLLASPTEPDTYYVVLRDTNPVDLLIESMDGTDASSLTGFKVTAEVVSDVELPTTHEPANEYYVAGMKRLFVENVAPECIITPEGDNTNRWEVAGGATSYTIRWQVRSDVDTDFTYSDDKAWTTPGIKVSFSGCDNGGDTFITEPRSGTFIPNFGSSQGDVDVVLTIEDKDHGIVTRTWHFTVTPSKMLETIANGPSGGITTSKLSQKYALLEDGIGMGHVYVSGATFVGADYFTLNWNCGKATDVKAYAFGYKTSAPDDNGTLEGGNLDVGIGPDGNMQAGNVLEKYFHYPYADAARPEDVKDSFFYCWLVHARSENDNTMTTLYLGDAFAPERPAVPGAQTKYAYATVPLPKALTEDKNYLTTTIEAIFSREWMPGDNLGDINQDGIPDYFAVRDWKEGNLIALAAGISGDSQGGNASGGNANGGNSNTGPAIAAYDLKDLAKENPDEDYLPGVYTSAEFESLVAHSENSYAPIGIPFNNRYEIRGFHDGLNAIDCTTSDPDFSKDEAAAWAAYAAASNLDVAVTNLTVWSPEPHGSKFARMDPTMEDTDGDHFPDGWEYFFWYQAHVWVPAQSGKFGKPKGLQRFVFERFDANNPLHGIEIPAIEVEQHFNPCEELKYHILDPKTYPDLDKDGLTDLEELALGTNPCHWDTDGDGMCDLYEVVYLLDPLTTGDRLSNTDGDYMAIHFVSGDWVYVDPDGAQDPESLDAVLYGVITSLERDVDVDGRGLVLRDLNVEVYKFQPKEDTTNPGNVLRYGEVIEPILPVDCGWGMPMVWMVENIKRKFIPAGTRLQSNLEYILVHDQVRKAFGFDPRTGWSMVSGDGYVADRWNPLINTELNPFDMTGWAENTGNYYAYDEYLLAMYRKRYSIVFADDVKESLLGRTTNPSAAAPASTEDAASTNETSTASQETTAQMKLAEYLAEAFKEGYSSRTADTSHGADTDGDGVPDGWEIYNYRSPNKVYDSGPSYDESTSFTSSGFKKGDYDGDHLTFAQEYAGTDSCNVYKSCPSIYANHPGNKSGWFNKFFPTDPGDYAEYKGEGDLYSHDTDGDGVPDDCEGMAWRGDFTNGADGYYGVWQSFIYGDPADALTCCIRGGGMNPCTADTDLDGLPDGWEMANAGVAISLQDLKPVMPKNLPAGASTDIRVERVSDGTLAGDGINRDTWAGKDGVYIAGGMDATWPGDACTSKGDLDKVDKLVGVARDVDFDHDGLQNYQEYLVQAVRHFRYDDITTPLMGRLLTEGRYDGNTLETPHAQQFCGFVTMESSDPEAFAVAAAEAWNLGEYVSYSLETTGVRRVFTEFDDGSVKTNIYYTTERVKQLVDGDTLVHKMVGNTDGRHSMPWTTEGWRKLGYFAPPAHPWDRSVTCMNFNNPMYLFPITGDLVIDERCAGYVGTDPRMADTDKDGMDDYYEMFHGLNPILGSYAEQPDASAWSGGKRGDIISATYSMTVIPPYQPYVRLFYNAFWNEWTHPDYNREAAFTPDFPSGNQPASGQNSVGGVALAAGLLPPAAYDPVLYPWTVGSPKVDADGDGMRNDEERIAPNVADPMPHHTDPSPAWFTDSSTRPSFVSQYYVTPAAALRMPLRPSVVEAEMVDIAMLGYDQGAYMFPFEENEGYDTDGDFVPDSREVTSPTLATSDPLRFDTPDRRQALYLDGVDSYAITKELEYRGVDAVDLLKQFTVECWICPEKSGVAQTIIDRAVYVDGSAVNKDACAIRSNFRIGLAPSGAVYGMFDNSDSIESGYNQPVSCQRVDGKVLPLNKWSHVALTYDGKELAIYVNGQVCRKAATSLVPANGVDRIVQEMDGLVGLSAYEYATQPSAVIVGARPKRENVYALYPIVVDDDGEHHESFDNLQEFFQGWVDEVRVWDGARSAEQIEANYLHRLTFDDALANRQEIFNGWLNLATRNNNDMNETLAPELVMHYNFSSIAGAADPVKVAQAPIGFSSKTLGAAQYSYDEGDNEDLVPDGLYANVKQLKGGDDGEVSWTDADGENRSLEIGWWKSSRVHSLVYRDYAYVPWIQNTVAHLPRFDGSSPDSFYYGEHRAANYSLPADVGYGKVAFPNSADPYSYCVYDFERYQRLFTAERLVEVRGEDYAEFKQETQFVYRNNFIGSSDLVPLGHAFAKTTTNFWDGAASDPWEYTGDDSNADGLPDWWEMYARENYCNGILSVGDELHWDTYVNYKNLKIPAWKAYLIDLNRGMQPGGSVDPAYAATFDSDRDGIPDWWEKMFGVFDYGADDDTDGDGLSNYAEYLLTEVFDLGIVFDPADPFSASFYESDYFYKIGELYAGEVFTDHDMMEDAWELQRGHGYVNSCAWDADSDNDEDRWSAFAECRYNSFSAGIIADNITHLVGDTELKDFPVPTLRLTLRYNQSQPLNVVSSGSAQTGNNGEQNALAPIVVKTFTTKKTQEVNVVPDSSYTIQPGADLDRVYDLGGYSERVVRGVLTPGYIEPGSFEIQTAHVVQNNNYTWIVYNATYLPCGTIVGVLSGGYLVSGSYSDYMYYFNKYGPGRVELQYEGFEWSVLGVNPGDVTASQDTGVNGGYICLSGERIGTLDSQTGEFSIDMAAFGKWFLEGTNSVHSLKESIFRIVYKSRIPALQSNKLNLYLGTPNVGAVREGKNRIVAFFDLNNDGNYTPGEPLGFANDVDVGWYQGVCEMELTDTSPVITRADLSQMGSSSASGLASAAASALSGSSSGGTASDRHVLYGNEDGDIVDLIVGELSGGSYQRFRVVRTLINGYGIQNLGVPNRVVVDKWIELDQRPFFFEGDVLENGELDIDWSHFEEEVVNNPNVRAANVDPTEVTYRIVLGNGTVEADATNNLYSIATVRHFDLASARPTPTTIAPGNTEATVYGSRPTFKWSLTSSNVVFNSYTAFKIQVMNESGSVVWDSGVRRAPAMNLEGVYSFTPDVYAGDLIKPDQKYTWRVSMYNAKFRTDKWSATSPKFQMFTQSDVHGYGSVKVCVKYYGPEAVLADGTVRVEAYPTPDFTGFPAARTYVADKATVSSSGVEHTANATLVGLPEGVYYVRAYIDGKSGASYSRDKWESWGYACPREVNPALMFSPTAIEVGSETAAMKTYTVYIEDVDTNGNCLPDAWEVVKGRGLAAGASSVEIVGGSAVTDDSLAGSLAGKVNADHIASRISSQVFSALFSADGAALVSNVPTTDGGKGLSQAAMVAQASQDADLEEVKITSISIEGGKVVVKAEGETPASRATSSGLRSMTAASEPEVVVKKTYSAHVLYATELGGGWRTADVPVVITVYSDGRAETSEIDVTALAGDRKACFFQIKID